MYDRARPLFEIVCFDVDSTISSLEGIDVLAGDDPSVAELTERAMNGEIPIEEVYGRRLEIVRPSARDLAELGQSYVESIVPGMEALIHDLLECSVDVHLVTAGIEQAVCPLADHLGIPARALHAVPVRLGEEGEYIDYDRSAPTSRANGKRTIVRNIRSRNKGRIAFIGDGGTDLETKEVVDCFIGFGGVANREIVRENADVFVTEKDGDSLRQYLFEESS